MGLKIKQNMLEGARKVLLNLSSQSNQIVTLLKVVAASVEVYHHFILFCQRFMSLKLNQKM